MRNRFLVLHDYGMGGLWWWIRAESARAVLETFAEVEIVDPAEFPEAAGWDLDEVDVDAPVLPEDLADLRAQRDGQRDRPGFGAFAGRSVFYLRRPWDPDDDTDPAVCLMEIGADGRRLRQVEMDAAGPAVRSGPDDWPLNPPMADPYDPGLPAMEITREEFEAAWERAVPAA